LQVADRETFVYDCLPWLWGCGRSLQYCCAVQTVLTKLESIRKGTEALLIEFDEPVAVLVEEAEEVIDLAAARKGSALLEEGAQVPGCDLPVLLAIQL